MNCAKWQKLILLRGSGELSAKKQLSLVRHLESCQSCRRFTEEYRVTSEALESLAAHEPSPAVLTRIGALLERQTSPRAAKLVPRLAVAAAAAAALVLVVVILSRLHQETLSPGPESRVAQYTEASEIDDLLALVSEEIELLGDDVALSSPEFITSELGAVEDAVEEMRVLLEET